MESPKLTLF